MEQFVPATAILNMPPPTIGVNIFTIYVLQSSLNSWLEAALVPPVNAPPGTVRSEEPFTGTAGPFLVENSAGTGVDHTFRRPEIPA